jgi:hypothetical protein
MFQDDVGKEKLLLLPGLELLPLGLPAGSPLIYRLSYPCSFFVLTTK